jgi:hypothetical protein
MTRKINDKGSALVSVLVITAFITIIATVMLYISSQNYQQKQTDYQNKQSFYNAEKALDYLKACLVDDIQDAYKAAYSETMQNYISLQTSQERERYYQEAYIAKLQDIWDEREGDSLEKVQSCMGSSELVSRIYKVEGIGTATDEEGNGAFVIKGVRAMYTDDKYTTFLYTDICLEIPPYSSTILETASESLDSESEREVIDLTDYVVYMNWRRADYSETETETETGVQND